MTAGELPNTLALDDLCSRCRNEVRRFHSGEAYDDSFCLEIFRRAITQGDQDCWRELQSIYLSQVVSWCRRAGPEAPLPAEDLAALAWEKFWSSFKTGQFEQANGTPAIQRYLKACAFSAVIDVVREQKAAVSLDRPVSDDGESRATLGESVADKAPTPEEKVTQQASRTSLWQVVGGHLTGERERVLVQLKFELGLSSAEVQLRRPDLFPSVGDVYRTTRNLLDRLRRSPDMRRWLTRDQS